VGLPLASLFSYSSMRQASSGHPFSMARMQKVGGAKRIQEARSCLHLTQVGGHGFSRAAKWA